MPRAANTLRISPEEWERRKDRIIDLYLNQGLKLLGDDGLIETMKEEGFSATKSQYETQLRGWNIRKNMTSGRWTEHFSQNGESSQTGEAREIYISGKLVSDSRIKTAQRRYAPGKGKAGRVAQSDNRASLEDSVASTSARGGQTSNGLPTSETVNSLPAEPVHEVDMLDAEAVDISNTNSDTRRSQTSDGLNMMSSMTINDSTNLGNSYTLGPLSGGSMDGVVVTHNTSPISLLSSQANVTTMTFPGDLQVGTLPSMEIVNLVFCYISKNNPGSSAYGPMSDVARLNLVGQFVADVTTSLSSNYEIIHDPHSVKSLDQILGNLVSDQNLIGGETQFTMLSEDDAFECRFLSRLLSSFVNSCAGLGNIRPGGILRFLSRQYDMKSLISQFMKSSSKYTAKSLAEITFQAALETDDDKIARLILESGFVNANETICFDQGVRYTPLQKAAKQQSFRIIKLLIDQKVDVNKSLQYGSALHLLIHNARRLSTLTPEFLSSLNAILEAGAIIEEEMLGYAISKVVDPRLARLLIRRSASRIPQIFVSRENLLADIAKNFDEINAIIMLELIIKGCQEFGGNPYLTQLRPGLEIAFNAAVRQGYDKLTQLLLPYGSHVDILISAIENQNQEIIDIVLNEISDSDLKEIVNVETLNAAMKAGNQRVISFLEDHNLADSLYQRRELGQVVTDAIEAGNIAYAYKLLGSYHNNKMEGSQFSQALKVALVNDYDELSWKLMAAGADLTSDFSQSPFYIAIKKRKADIVRAIFESGIHPEGIITHHDDDGSSPLELIMEWGDDSILQDFLKLCSCWSGTVYSTKELALAIEKGGMDLFWKLIEFGRNRPSLENALEVAIDREDLSLLDELIDLGANPTSSACLEVAVLQKHSMLKPLLNRVRKINSRAPYDAFVLKALTLALSQYPQTCEVLDVLITSKLVDLNAIQEYTDTDGRRSALGVAIKGGKDRSEVRHQDIELVKKLLDGGGDPNSTTTDGYRFNTRQTALLDAIETRSTDMVKLLLQYGARVNEPASFGLRRTPLQGAVETGNIEMIQLLLSKGADVNAEPAPRGGGTALQLAAMGGNCTIARLLIEHGARFDILPSQHGFGRWPLENAAENGRLDMVQLLWNANSGQFDDRQCEKAKRLAEHSGHNACRDRINELMAMRQMNFQPQLIENVGAVNVGAVGVGV
ncbi:ankyrin [Annulohypoxylon moriforme]|nr:ankyrin [Annulohypoxylon moriforme]